MMGQWRESGKMGNRGKGSSNCTMFSSGCETENELKRWGNTILHDSGRRKDGIERNVETKSNALGREFGKRKKRKGFVDLRSWEKLRRPSGALQSYR